MKCRFSSTRLHGTKSQKAVIFTVKVGLDLSNISRLYELLHIHQHQNIDGHVHLREEQLLGGGGRKKETWKSVVLSKCKVHTNAHITLPCKWLKYELQ
jgi:hypothetical protein